MFGNQGKPQKPPTKPGQRRSSAESAAGDPKTLEGSLKRVLDSQDPADSIQEAAAIEGNPEIDAPLVHLVNALLIESIRTGASDIHIEPFETFLRVRLRVDGVLQEIQKVPQKLAAAITSRLKIMADLDICEKRIPQDGCIKFRSGTFEADFRMNTLPSVFGEKIVMRVMSSAAVNNDLSKLGIPEQQLKTIREAINRPDGLVLVTGPTGSGKTTTLYAALNELNDISVSVFTAEDPVEGTLLGVTQSQVNGAVGYTFAQILRSLLRQDPDVILVGEIRDQETAEISIKAALTGHLVLSTLHTNCAVSTISRLLNMGIAPYLITSSVGCVVAQRLVRRICGECAYERPATPDLIAKIGPAADNLLDKPLKYGKGCKKCNGTGYKGRAPVYEVLSLSDDLRQLILHGTSREDLKIAARREGMVTLRESGIALVRNGITTLEEVLGATNEDAVIQPVTHSSAPSITAPSINAPSPPAPSPIAATHVANPLQQTQAHSTSEEVVVGSTTPPATPVAVPQTQISSTPYTMSAPVSQPAPPMSHQGTGSPTASMVTAQHVGYPTDQHSPPPPHAGPLQPSAAHGAPSSQHSPSQEGAAPSPEELASRWKRTKGG